MNGPSDPSEVGHVGFTGVGGLRIACVRLGEARDDAVDLTSDDFRTAARLGGIAAAAAAFELLEVAPVFAISVGPCVARGVPTAARATISARVPLRHGVMEAQFGGPFAAAFARRLDTMLVFGSAGEGCVLQVDDSGVRLERSSGPASSVLQRARDVAVLRAGLQHVLTTGPAADAGIPFANLAQFDGAPFEEAPFEESPIEESPIGGGSTGGAPSYVGRGGLGATIRGAGVLAVTVADAPAGDRRREPTGAEELRALLRTSPRLISRSAGGTLELASTRGVPMGNVLKPDPAERHGCTGCPTPCGWSFDGGPLEGPTTTATRVGARFSALQPFFGSGDTGSDDVVRHVAACNEIGVDARTAARVLAEVAEDGTPESPRTLVEVGTRAHDRALSWSPDDEAGVEGGGAFQDLASRVGGALAARGPEPMRSSPVYGPQAASPEEQGAIAYWNECFAAAIDLSGFCAFSAAALVADEVTSLTRLASEIAPPAGWPDAAEIGPALAMMRAGETHTARHRRLGGGASPMNVAGEFERAYAGYAAASREGVTERPPRTESHGGSGRRFGAGAPGTATVHVRATGPLARRLGLEGRGLRGSEGGLTLVMHGRITVRGVLEALAQRAPRARRWLLTPEGRPVPIVTHAGTVLGGSDEIEPSSTVDLVLVVAGG